MKIILDGMGGDNAPFSVVEGAVLASRETQHHICIIGQEEMCIRDSIGDNTVPSGGGRRRKSDGLCRRHRYQDKTSEARRRRYDRTFYTEEGNSPVDHAGRNLVDKSNVIYYTLV